MIGNAALWCARFARFCLMRLQLNRGVRRHHKHMRIADYILAHAGIDWPVTLQSWGWLLPDHLTVWIANRFADLILVFEDGTVHYLDVGAGTVTRIAENREDFLEQVDTDQNATDWFMIPMVDSCVATGMRLSPGACYAFRQLPVFGGEYSADNVMIAKVEGYLKFAGLVHAKVRDLPDGTQVEIVLTPDDA